eukprot:GHUV01048549.1.p1 GENE.GHUV01048549.1~~GHUV01048549.1.p1  ORF type:complete len:126 (+),score=3.49 GHUV01048549.1:250-627(+)
MPLTWSWRSSGRRLGSEAFTADREQRQLYLTAGRTAVNIRQIQLVSHALPTPVCDWGALLNHQQPADKCGRMFQRNWSIQDCTVGRGVQRVVLSHVRSKHVMLTSSIHVLTYRHRLLRREGKLVV